MGTIQARRSGQTKEGKQVTAFELRNGAGMSADIFDYGGTVRSLVVPDREGKPTDVVLGYDDILSYENGGCSYGGIVGRFANRIGKARFVLDGREYLLEKHKVESNHLHGVFIRRVFEAETDGDALVLRYLSPSMEEGFPGDLTLEVRYRLSDDNALEISYTATTNAPTVLNLTNHSYFNLSGQDGSTVMDHRLWLNSSYFTEYNGELAQTGNILPVEGTPLDFRTAHAIGARAGEDFQQLRLCSGYDHNMVLDGEAGEMKKIGTVWCDRSGIRLDASTTEPAVQFYCANHLDSDPVPHGKNGIRYPRYGGFCLEAQHYPDSVNHPDFPSTVLRPGETYRQTTVYRFTTFDRA